MGHQVVDQQGHRAAGGALGFAGVPGGAGDVQVGPGVVLGEAAQEAGSRDGAGRPAADVGHVGEVAVELALVFVPERQAPGAVAGALAGGQQFVGQFVVVGQQAGGVVAQGDDAGTCEGGHVDYGSRVKFLHVGEGVAQYQAAFGVGVEDFNGHAAQGGYDVARSGGAAIRHVFGGRNHRDYVDFGLGFSQYFHGAEYAGGTAHVVFHLVHAFAGLEADAAGVEGDAFTHQHVGLVLGFAATVFHHDQARWLLGAFAYGQDGVHTHLFHLLFIKHFGLDAVVFLGHGLCLFSQPYRVADVGRGVTQILGVVHAAAGGQAQVESIFQGFAGTRGLYGYFLELAGSRLFALEAGEAVQLVFQDAANQVQARFFVADSIFALQGSVGQADQGVFGRALFQGAHHGNQSLAEIGCGAVAVFTGAKYDNSLPGLVDQRQGINRGVFAGQVAGFYQLLYQPSQCFVRCFGGVWPFTFLRQTDHQAVGFCGGNGLAAQAEIHGNSCRMIWLFSSFGAYYMSLRIGVKHRIIKQIAYIATMTSLYERFTVNRVQGYIEYAQFPVSTIL